MEPLAVLETGRPTTRVASSRGGHVRARSLRRTVDGRECDPASQAFGEYDAKYVNCRPRHGRPANLKPNIYYKAQDFAWMVEDAACGR